MYTLNKWIARYMNYISIELLKNVSEGPYVDNEYHPMSNLF